ncbi:molybdenum ABC transporter ATP-binding protein [Cricetibacter osteomyelitidis]|uniref:Molybdenum ABC transporter ATP-binding protein n=1 Tax=Cricetibacter osteomyelitidis TaxID=1521931 RepID=A0A4R2SXG7_9PAST|nr:molybdenum ABC transporter ATP-binding protein [Cricetibacter osteomyelitidis]
MLEIIVKKQFLDLTLDVDLQLPAKGVTGIFGLSGAGKSTLINLVAGLLSPDDGKIVINDRTLFDRRSNINLAPEKRHIAYVFQDARLFPHYKVKGNLQYGMKCDNSQHVDDIVNLLGLNMLLNRYPYSLSGGEKQRVAIGRALLSEPELLLMDEPLSGLDLPRKRELLSYLEALTRQIEIPILYVSHSLNELQALADHVVLLEDGKVLIADNLPTVWASEHFQRWQQAAHF